MKYQISEAQQALEIDPVFSGKFSEDEPTQYDFICPASGDCKPNQTLDLCRERLQYGDNRFCIKCPIRKENGLEMVANALGDLASNSVRAGVHKCDRCGDIAAQHMKRLCPKCLQVGKDRWKKTARDRYHAKKLLKGG